MAWCVVALYGKIRYLEPKHTFLEIQMLRNNYQEDSTDG